MEDEEGFGKKAARTLSSLLLGKFLVVLITGATLVVVARLLGPSGYGIYTLAFGFSALVGAVGHFGIGTYFNKHLSEYSYSGNAHGISEALSAGYLILILVAAAFTLLGILLSGYVAAHVLQKSGISSATLVLASLSIFFSMLFGASYSGLIGLGSGKWASISNISEYMLQMVVSVALVVMGFGPNGAIIGLLSGYAFGFAVAIFALYKKASRYGKIIFMPRRTEILKALRFSLPVAGNNLLNTGTTNFATVLLGIYATALLLGNYGTAYRGLNLMLVVYGTIGAVLLPMFSAALAGRHSVAEIERLFERSITYSIAIALPVIVYVIVLSKPIVYIFLTKSYGTAPLYLSVIALGAAASLIPSYLSSILIGTGNVYRVFKNNILAALAQLASLYLLVPRFSAIGAIVSILFIGSAVQGVLFIRLVRQIFGARMRYRRIASLFASGALLAAVIYAVTYLPYNFLQLAVGAAAVAVAYPGMLMLLGVLDRTLLEDVRRIAGRVFLFGSVVAYLSAYYNIFSKVNYPRRKRVGFP